MAKNSFSIDIGESTTKLVDASIKNNAIEIESIGLVPNEKLYFSSTIEKINENQADSIVSLAKKLKVSKTKVNVIIPDSLSYNQIVEMPKLNEKELLSAIKYQADQFIPMPIDEVSIDIEIIYEKVSDKKILTFISAAPKKTIEKIQETMQYAGLIVDSIETEASACGRLFSEIYKTAPVQTQDSTQGTLFVNLGFSSTSLYFFNDTYKVVTHIHNFNIGYRLFMKEIQVNLNISDQEIIDLLKTFGGTKSSGQNLETMLAAGIKDFLFQIQRFISLLSEQHKTRVTAIYVYNEIFHLGNFVKTIEDYFKMPTSLFNLATFIKADAVLPEIKGELGFFLAALGGNFR